MRRPAVIFGGPAPEHVVSILTGLPAARALAGRPAGAEAIYWSLAGGFYSVDPHSEATDFAEGAPRRAKRLRLVAGAGGGFSAGGPLGRGRPLDITAVVNCCHGGPGEDGTLQAAFDLAEIRYTGPTPAGAALGMDKLAFAAVVAGAGLPRLPCAALRATPPPFAGPYILKPRFGGSSIGIDVVADFATARARLGANPHLRAGAVIEPYREGADDINVAVRSYPELQLSAIERPLRSPGSGPILGYADKYVPGQGMAAAARECPAQLPAPIEQAVRDMALAVAELAGVRGVARVDFLLDGDELFVNELNTIPGSLSRQLWVDPPLAFGDLLDGLVAEAIAAPARRYATEGADPALLRAVGSISGKLA